MVAAYGVNRRELTATNGNYSRKSILQHRRGNQQAIEVAHTAGLREDAWRHGGVRRTGQCAVRGEGRRY
ncbi:hypothetical protein GDO81_012014 [Engystomops pustulosus]|uniref:Uncharacterized protein n=1 Tax=Engystomops pustulosus TaxID=76066 RepID=A0AAV7BIQ9_ENGPU|nr:hypothetical protein GDO81_012014 [Engystomops pustulosus]